MSTLQSDRGLGGSEVDKQAPDQSAGVGENTPSPRVGCLMQVETH